MITDDYTDMHTDGSPLGNGRISDGTIKECSSVAKCPDKNCMAWPKYHKRFSNDYFTCKTFLKRTRRKYLLKDLLKFQQKP
jgi:hypothetical protein